MLFLSVISDPPISIGGSLRERFSKMFDHEIVDKKHFTGKDGIGSYEDWCRRMKINAEDFPFRLNNFGHTRRGVPTSLSVVSWGFYQGSDWRYYIFITYRSSDNRYTCAYHWDVDDQALPVGTPRKHEWTNR